MTKIFFDLPTVSASRAQAGLRYQEFLRVPVMSAGVYVLARGGKDLQTPHKEAELYYVVRGRARMRVGEQEHVVRAGGVIFVAPEVKHYFFDISEELELLVMFAPQESS
jgi:mannose-6-phosphate isomerase-like protein (cupin superfamily)